LVIERSLCGVSVSVSVAESLPLLVSVNPPGAVTVAVFDSDSVAAELIVPVAVYVTELPGGIVSVSLMLPDPAAVLPVAPPEAMLVNATPVIVAGNVSATVAPVAVDGPALLTVIV
jgi:hypothetical protein